MSVVLAYLFGTLILMIVVCVMDDYERHAGWTCAMVLTWPLLAIGAVIAIVILVSMAICSVLIGDEK